MIKDQTFATFLKDLTQVKEAPSKITAWELILIYTKLHLAKFLTISFIVYITYFYGIYKSELKIAGNGRWLNTVNNIFNHLKHCDVSSLKLVLKCYRKIYFNFKETDKIIKLFFHDNPI